MNYLSLYDSDWLRFCDLQDKPRLVTIAKVAGGEIRNAQKKSKKPIVHFKEYAKPLALNKCNGKAIATLYTNETNNWVGKQVVLYPSQTQFGLETVDCIRVRAPGGKAAAPPPVDDESPQADEATFEPAAEPDIKPATNNAADLAEVFGKLEWKAQQRDMWCKERFGRVSTHLTPEMYAVAFKLLYAWGRPDEYKSLLADAQKGGLCK